MSNQPATRKDIDDILHVMQDFMQHTDERFNKIESTLGLMANGVTDLRSSHDRLLNTIDSFVGRIDRYETEQAARDSQFDKLLAWARKVSEKTGIPLDNL